MLSFDFGITVLGETLSFCLDLDDWWVGSRVKHYIIEDRAIWEETWSFGPLSVSRATINP